MGEAAVFSKGSFFHGTKVDLQVGDDLLPGHKKNYNDERRSRYVYFAGTLDAAIWGAELADGDGKERIYVVEPTEDFEDDPNVTDKKFPGNPTKSYRTMGKVKIVAEVTGWQRHPAKVRKAMLDHLKKLEEAGIRAID